MIKISAITFLVASLAVGSANASCCSQELCWKCKRDPAWLCCSCCNCPSGSVSQDDSCLIHTKTTGQCFQCKRGLAIKRDEQGSSSCVKGTILACAHEEVVRGGSRVCHACEEGKYVVIDPQTKASTCRAIAQPVENCLWGGAALQGNKRGPGCYRCKPGFAVDFYSGRCVRAERTGCLIQDHRSRCFACNLFEGYFMTEEGACVKTE